MISLTKINMRILHIFHDDKFLDVHLRRFQKSDFDNRFIYLKSKFSYNGPNVALFEYISPGSSDYKKLVEDSGEYDLVFLYGLNYHLSKYLIKARSNIKGKVIVHFYGAEVYNIVAFPFYSGLFLAKTSEFGKHHFFMEFLKSTVFRSRYYLLDGRSIGQTIKLAFSMLDYFAWYVKNEYDYIKERVATDGLRFPEFLFMPIMSRVVNNGTYINKRKILVGNSGSRLNNHADVFDLLEKGNVKNEIVVPFSYGVQGKYRDFLEKRAKCCGLDVTFLTDFLEYEEYLRTFEDAKIAVFAAQRQMALGNILIALNYGVKIYLSGKTPIYSWLKDEGFNVYSIENDLVHDLENDELTLSIDEQLKNQKILKKLYCPDQNVLFLNSLKTLK